MIYVIARKTIAICVEHNRVRFVATAKRDGLLRELRDPIDVQRMMPARRQDQTWFDPSECTLYLSAVCMFDFALWLIAEGRFNPPKSRIGWRGRGSELDKWFGGGTGDTVPSMVREGVAIVAGYTLEGENEVFKNWTFDGSPGTWFALNLFVKSGLDISPPPTVEIS